MADVLASVQLNQMFRHREYAKVFLSPGNSSEESWMLRRQQLDILTSLLPIILAVLVLILGSREKKDPFEYKLFERPQGRMTRNVVVSRSRNIVHRLTEAKSEIAIFWGSQSGTAENLARRLGRDLKRVLQLRACVVDVSEIDPETLSGLQPGTISIFIFSTYGNGDPSDNAIEFVDYLTTTSTPLPGLRYAIFGLGNCNYQYYNRIADIISTRLVSLGSGTAFLIGKTDEVKQTTDEDFIDWKDQLFDILRHDLNIQGTEYKYEPMMDIARNSSSELSEVHLGSPIQPKHAKVTMTPFLVKASHNLTPSKPDGAMCLHIELDLGSNYSVKYKTGDYMEVWPSNSDYEVERLLSQLDLDGNGGDIITIRMLEEVDDEPALPTATTISATFKNYVQVGAPISRETIKALCHFAPSETALGWLQRISDKESYQKFLSGKYFTFADLLEQSAGKSGAWGHLPLSFVVEQLPTMRPRRYSISSSSLVSPRQLSLTVATKPAVQRGTRTSSHMALPGLATSYLAAPTVPVHHCQGNAPAPMVLGRIIRSKYKLPFNAATPLVLVSAGSGIAPFRAFLQERARLNSLGHNTGHIIMLYGCRSAVYDYLYNTEIQQLADGPLADRIKIHVAFSRPEQPAQRRYVQNLLQDLKVKQAVAEALLDLEGAIYFCGSTAMAKAAGKAVLEGVSERSRMDGTALTKWLDEKRRYNKWQEDVWG